MTQFSYGKFQFTALTETTCKVGWNESIEGNGAVEGINIKGSIVIPSVAKDYSNNKTYIVTETGRYSFRKCTKLTNVILPDTLTALRFDSFFITSITKLMIPMSVETLGNSCFSGMQKLKEVIFEKGSLLKLIENNVFYNDISLEYIQLPPGINRILSQAFYGCSNLKEIHFCSCYDASSISNLFEYANQDVQIFVTSCYQSSLFGNITITKGEARCSFNQFPILKLCYHITQKQNSSIYLHYLLTKLFSLIILNR